MLKIKLHDKLFSHANTIGNGNRTDVTPQYFEWYRGPDSCEISVFTDQSLDEAWDSDSRIKIALLMESPEVFPQPYEKILATLRAFDYVLSFDVKTLTLIDSQFDYGKAYGRLFHLGGCWIDKPMIYPKTKEISIIASAKNQTEGHRLRHEIIELCGDSLDVFGAGYNPIPDKLDGLRDYRFTVVVENCRRDMYFTEKLVDAWATGTIPLYWGCPSIEKVDGCGPVVPLETAGEFRHMVEYLTRNGNGEKFYDSRHNDILIGFHESRRFWVTEDRLWNMCLREICGGL